MILETRNGRNGKGLRKVPKGLVILHNFGFLRRPTPVTHCIDNKKQQYSFDIFTHKVGIDIIIIK